MRNLTFTLLLLLSFQLAYCQKENFNFSKDDKTISFIPNRGQWPSEYKFLLKTPGINTWITNNGIIYDYYMFEFSNQQENNTFLSKLLPDKNDGIVKGHIIKMTFKDCNSDLSFKTYQEQNTTYNYFVGNKSQLWVSNVPLVNKIIIQNVYPSINMELYIENESMRYNFIVNPGGNPKNILLELSGADDIKITNNNLIITTQLGGKKQGDIKAFQNSRDIGCKLTIINNNIIGFNLDTYDTNKVLCIDPLVFSTFLGGSSEEVATSVTTGTDNYVYVAGYTWSIDYPIINGAYQHDLSGADDIFVSKFSEDGQHLISSTFIGGTYSDYAKKIKYKNGKIYVTGTTYSENFPISQGAYQETIQLSGDIFVLSLSENLGTLNFSTYFGGKGFDTPNGLDINNHILVGGYTDSNDLPITANGYGPSFGIGNGLYDGFIFKMNLSGSILEYSTYFGSTGDDEINDIAFINNDTTSFIIVGQTTSEDFPVSEDAYDSILGNGGSNEDAFVAKFSNSSLVYSTYLGGQSTDYAEAVTIGPDNKIMLTGTTYSDDFPTSPNAFSSSKEGIYQDAFVCVLSPDGITNTNDLTYSTYLGGFDEEEATSILLENPNKLYVSGYTHSSNFPTSENAVSPQAIGNYDAFLTLFDLTNGSISYSTFLGGSFDDECLGIAQKQNGEIILTGYTTSFNFPVTTNAYSQNIYSENHGDAFLSSIFVEASAINEFSIIKNTHIGQNMPNPFKYQTIIPFKTNKCEAVTFYLRDIFSEEIFKNTLQFQPGEHLWKITKHGLKPGIYFYTLKTKSWIETGKMLVQ